MSDVKILRGQVCGAIPLTQKGGEGLLVLFQYSPYKALHSLFPDHDWVPWSFCAVRYYLQLHIWLTVKGSHWVLGRLEFQEVHGMAKQFFGS